MALVWDVIEIILGLAVLAFFVTQVIVPIARRTTLYPLFKSREHKLVRDLNKARQAVVEDGLKKEIKKTQDLV